MSTDVEVFGSVVNVDSVLIRLVLRGCSLAIVAEPILFRFWLGLLEDFNWVVAVDMVL